MDRPRILFVDDEPGIIAMMPVVLEKYGFDVTAVQNVKDALAEINQNHFEVLLTDLNIGQPGDGFTLASVMKRVSPSTGTMIISGFPDFQRALSAIHNQVDDYMTKPPNMRELVEKLKKLLPGHKEWGAVKSHIIVKRVPELLKECISVILERFYDMLMADPVFKSLSLSKEQHLDQGPVFFARLIETVNSPNPEKIPLDISIFRGKKRKEQGYNIPMLVEESRLLMLAIFSVMQEQLLNIDLSLVIPDLMKISDFFSARLKIAIEAYQSSSVDS